MNERAITMATGILPERRKKLIRLYARLLEPERIMVHAEQQTLLDRYGAGWTYGRETLAYCTLLRALDECNRLGKIGSSRVSKADDLAQADRMLMAKVKARRKKSRTGTKRDKLVIHMLTIKRLHDDGLSWREIVVWLKQRLKLTVAPTYVCRLYKECCPSLSVTKGRPPALPADRAAKSGIQGDVEEE